MALNPPQSRAGPSRPRTKPEKIMQAPGTTVALDMTNSTATPTTVETSVELMQKLMHFCVSALARKRHMFPETCYGPQLLDLTSQPTGARMKPKPDLHEYQILKKGFSERVDRLINLLVGVVSVHHYNVNCTLGQWRR
jgi:hypothetical protein